MSGGSVRTFLPPEQKKDITNNQKALPLYTKVDWRRIRDAQKPASAGDKYQPININGIIVTSKMMSSLPSIDHFQFYKNVKRPFVGICSTPRYLRRKRHQA